MNKQVAVVVFGYASQKRRAAFAAVSEQMAYQCACRSLSMCAGYSHASLSLRDLSQHARALYHPVALLLHMDQLSHVLRNGRGIYDQRIFRTFRDIGYVIGIVHLYTFLLKSMSQGRRGLVISADIEPFYIVVSGNGTHADTAYSYEIYILIHTCKLLLLSSSPHRSLRGRQCSFP